MDRQFFEDLVSDSYDAQGMDRRFFEDLVSDFEAQALKIKNRWDHFTRIYYASSGAERDEAVKNLQSVARNLTHNKEMLAEARTMLNKFAPR